MTILCEDNAYLTDETHTVGFYRTLISVDQILQHDVIMLFCREVCVTFLLIYSISVVSTDHHLNANGPFGKRHSIDDEPSPYSCHRGAGVVSHSDPLRTMMNADLNVSATVYASLDQIEVTWPSTLNSCSDDFVGIYFVEIPIDTGTNRLTT